MNGMIFAAGLGSRLRPLTNDRPKALVELNGKTLLERVIAKLKNAGITRLIINVHHYAEQIESFIKQKNYPDLEIILSDERDMLLDTGGAILKAKQYFQENKPLLIHNVDILTDVNLIELLESHQANDNYATMVVKNTDADRVLKFNSDGILKGWENKVTGEQKIVDESFYTSKEYNYCGVQVLSPQFIQNIHYKERFSVIDEHLWQAKTHDIKSFIHNGTNIDLGTPEAINTASLLVN